jgi:hypothetical protein
VFKTLSIGLIGTATTTVASKTGSELVAYSVGAATTVWMITQTIVLILRYRNERKERK